MADAVPVARALPAPQRLETLAAALLVALARDADAQRATHAATAALPSVAHAIPHTDRWLADELAAALDGDVFLARAALILLSHLVRTLDPEDTEARAACACLLAVRLAGAPAP